MKRLNGKKMILWIMTLILCVTTCAPAFASVGDRTLLHVVSEDSSYERDNIKGVFRLKDGFCIITSNWVDTKIQKFTALDSEPEIYQWTQTFDGMEAFTGEAGEGEFPAGMEEITDVTYETPATEEEPEKTEIPAEPEEIPEEAGAPAAEEGGEEEDLFADMDWDAPEEEEIFYGDIGDRPEDWFVKDGELYALCYERKIEQMESRYIAANIKHAKLENGEVILEDSDLAKLDLENLTEDGSYFSLNGSVICGNYLATLYYAENGYNLAMFDLTTGECREMPAGEHYETIALGPDNTLLAAQYGEEKRTADGIDYKLVRINPETGESEPFLSLGKVNNYRVPICYDQEKNTLYYVAQGEVWAKQGDTDAVAVNDCPIEADSAMVYDDFVILWDYTTIVAKNTDPSKRSGATLRIRSIGYSDFLSGAILEMTNTHGDISVIADAGSYGITSGILQDMMNQDGHTDIYILSLEGQDYRAMLERGYLADMSGNKQLDEYVDRMYPYLQEALKVDGKLVAVPLIANGNGLGIALRTWKKLGGTEEELPKTWNQFFDWLENDVQERIVGTDARVTAYDKRSMLFGLKATIIYQYQTWLNKTGKEQVFNTPLLKDPLKRVDNLDWAALKISEDDLDTFMWSSDNPPLLETNQSPGFTTWGSGTSQLLLSFEEGEDPVIPVNLIVAVINPYSTQQEIAKEFLALAMKNLETAEQYTFFSDKTEPIEEANNKSWYESCYESVETIKEKLKDAEGEQKATLEQSLRDAEFELATAEEYRWVISPKDIENYQKNLPYMKVLDYYFLYDIFNTSDYDELQDAYEKLYGEEDPEATLSLIDSKIQTIRKEGN
ncbi:MAG: carbohydrate ABC transporter substrate-binding protein [Clostridia bacterium]|nr:carbohydrate ABC transporter substrate-binding protein [Clostridia bacterium]